MREITFTKKDYIRVIAEIASYIDSLDDDKEYILTIKDKKKKRSLDANAYAWVLMDKIASEMHKSKIEVYQDYIKDIGGNSDIICIQDKALDKFREIWEKKGIGWTSDTMPSKIDGCTNVIVYYGSSTYDSKQMSVLIDRIVQDCKELGIETLSPDELLRLQEEWGG